MESSSQPLPGSEAPILTQDAFAFRDLNKNGRLDPYEDSRRPIEERVEDLLASNDPGRENRADVPHHHRQ